MVAKKRPIIGVQVINISCSCGGACVNEQDSSMVEVTDIYVTCESCGERYNVPASAFKRITSTNSKKQQAQALKKRIQELENEATQMIKRAQELPYPEDLNATVRAGQWRGAVINPLYEELFELLSPSK